MQRRDVLKAFGAATALALLPGEAVAAWERVASGSASSGGLSTSQLALIGAVADTILPRSDTPSATDVRVPAFIDVIVSENYSDSAREAFVAGLSALEGQLRADNGTTFVELDPEHRAVAIGAVERMTDRRSEPANTYWRLKGLIIHGYFTSEPIMKGPLNFEMMPGRFDGAAPMLGS
jgi:pyocin large subunit-like protein